jgi:hypothetical protein
MLWMRGSIHTAATPGQGFHQQVFGISFNIILLIIERF